MAGNYDPNKDYAAAIKNATSDSERKQLISERQNKIDAMNASGTNTKGYTNSIYTGTTVSSGNRNSGASGGKNSGSSGGYYDPNKDYAAAIQNAATKAERDQLIAERQNKIDAMNAAGTNTGGYTNAIYEKDGFNRDYTEAKGQYRNQDTGIWQEKAAQPTSFDVTAEAQENIQPAAAELPEYAKTTAAGNIDPVQQAALQAYYTRQKGTAAAQDTMGVYAGDESLSLPDQQKIKDLQALWNQGKAEGNQAMMDAAARQAESIRDDYRYYPLANTDGYGLGENKLGYIRDMVVRVDDLGNRYVDEYGLNNVTTTRYNADGTKSWTNVNDIDSHDDYVARQMDRSAEYGNDWTAIRVADAADAQLGTAELMSKYGAEGGEGRALYTDARINGKIANGKTLADLQREAGILPAAANASAYGYFDPSMDYAAAIATETDATRRAQLMAERQNKINYLNGTGQNTGGYTNAIYGVTAAAPVTQEAVLPEYVGLTADEINAQYNDIAKQMAAQRQNYLDLTLAQNQAAQNDANANYDNIARQAYILKRQQEQALPQQLAALGISGGGSETANLRLQTNYQNNLNQNEQARQQAMKEYALEALAAQTAANSDIAGYYADAKQNAMGAVQNQQAQQNAYNQWLAEYQQGLKEYQNAMTQQAYENNLEASRYNYDRQLAEAEMAAQMGDYSKLAALGFDTSALVAEEAAKAAKSSRSSRTTYDDNDTDDQTPADLPTGNEMGDGWIMVSGLGKVALNEIDGMLAKGELKKVALKGKNYYMKA